jgi:hypothetical protein
MWSRLRGMMTGWEECLREYEPVTGAELEREGRWGSIWAIVSYASFGSRISRVDNHNDG